MLDLLDRLLSWWDRLSDRARRATRDTSTPSPSIWDRDGLVGRKLHDPEHDLEPPDRLR